MRVLHRFHLRDNTSKSDCFTLLQGWGWASGGSEGVCLGGRCFLLMWTLCGSFGASLGKYDPSPCLHMKCKHNARDMHMKWIRNTYERQMFDIFQYIHIYIYMYSYIFQHIPVYSCISLYNPIYSYIYICMFFVLICSYIFLYIFIHIYIYIHTGILLYSYTFMYMPISSHIFLHTHIYI